MAESRRLSFAADAWLAMAVWTVIAVATSLAGAPITGEEEYEVVIIRKIAENSGLAWDNLMHHPGELTTYLVTPHYFQQAAIAGLAGGEILGVYAKGRLLDVLLSGASIYAIGRAVLGTARGGFVASLFAAILVTLDPAPTSVIASLLPLARRGSIAAGLLLPAAVILTMDTLRRGGWWRALVTGLLCLVTAMTHALEGAHFFFFGIAAAFVALVSLVSGSGDRRFASQAALVLVASALCLGGFRLVHSRVATDVVTYEAPRQSALLQSIVQRLESPAAAIAGPLTDEGAYVLRQTMPFLPYPIFALLAGAVLVPLRRSAYLAVPWTVLCLVLLVHVIPVATLLAMYLTTSEIFLVFGILGLASVPLIAAATEAGVVGIYVGLRRWRPALQGWPLLLATACSGAAIGLALSRLAVPVVGMTGQMPWVLVGVVLVLALAALVVGRRTGWRFEPQEPLPLAALVVGVVCLSVPMVLQVKPIAGAVYSDDPGRVTLIEHARDDWTRPDPLNTLAYYPTLKYLGLSGDDRNLLASGRSVAPLMPYDVVLWLRASVPPQRVILSRPSRIYALAVMTNEYVAHAGFEIETKFDLDYLNTWVTLAGGHPFFGAPRNPELEAEFLRRWDIGYVLVDPENQGTTGSQLTQESERFETLSTYGGYTLFRIR